MNLEPNCVCRGPASTAFCTQERTGQGQGHIPLPALASAPPRGGKEETDAAPSLPTRSQRTLKGGGAHVALMCGCDEPGPPSGSPKRLPLPHPQKSLDMCTEGSGRFSQYTTPGGQKPRCRYKTWSIPVSARQGVGRSQRPAPSPKVAVPSESLTFNIPQLIHQPGSALRQTSCRLMMDVWAAGRLQSTAKPCSAWEQGAGEGSPLTLSPGTAAFVGSSGLCGFVLPPHMLMALSCPPALGGVIKTPQGWGEACGGRTEPGVSNSALGGGRVLPGRLLDTQPPQGCELR